MLVLVEHSNETQQIKEPTSDPINLFSQFFISDNPHRYNEIKYSLMRNVANPDIDKIYLLNERIYTEQELGIKSDKIILININHRLKFSDFFTYSNKTFGYNILINIDIFLDNTVQHLRLSDIHIHKKIYSQLRYEYYGNHSKIYGSEKDYECRPDSVDTWIIHSNNKLTEKEINLFNFQLGQLGCDNKVTYLFKIIGYDCYNDPDYIVTHHNHRTNHRTYNTHNRITGPYMMQIPARYKINRCQGSLGVQVPNYNKSIYSIFNINNSNIQLYSYVSNKLATNKSFHIPLIEPEMGNLAIIGYLLHNNKIQWNNDYNNLLINTINKQTIIPYGIQYINSLTSCEILSIWEPWSYINATYNNMYSFIINNMKKYISWNISLIIYYNIYHNPWTRSLNNKRILVISNHIEQIKHQLTTENYTNIYPQPIFINNSFITFNLSTKNIPIMQYLFEINNLLDKIKDHYDIVIINNLYGNIIANIIHQNYKKSAINVGPVLLQYFGIYNDEWKNNHPEIYNLYVNDYWLNI
jgi:hypothetical protein